MDIEIFGTKSHRLCYSVEIPKNYRALECKCKLASTVNALKWLLCHSVTKMGPSITNQYSGYSESREKSS